MQHHQACFATQAYRCALCLLAPGAGSDAAHHVIQDLSPIKRFADSICSQVIQVLPRDPLVCEAELFRKTIVDYSPESPVAQGVQNIVEYVLGLDSASVPVPTPIPDAMVRDIMRGGDVPGEISTAPRVNPASTITQWSQL